MSTAQGQNFPGGTFRILTAENISFRKDTEGNILLNKDEQEQVIANVTAAFPLSDPQKMISLRDHDGQEIGILDDVSRLDPHSKWIISEALERSYFMPRITDILDIQENLNVIEWEVETDKGLRTFEVRNVRKNVRRIGQRQLIIKDVDGNRYEIRDWMTLPPHPQKLLEPYL